MVPIYIMNFLFAISTTIGMTIIPLLITDGLGLSLLTLGIIEGSAEFISNLLRLITGNIFDRIKNRRSLFVLPSIIAFLSKIVLCFPNPLTVVVAKSMERISNGAFAAPRDAYIGENSTNKGLALGFLSFSKTLGCILGPLVISAVTIYFGSFNKHIFLVILLACLINFICLGLSFFVNIRRKITLTVRDHFTLVTFNQSFKNLYIIFILSFLFFLGRFNDGIIMMYLKSQAFPEWFYLGTISFFNMVMLVISPLLGLGMDKGKDNQILLITIIALLGFNILFFNVINGSWILSALGLACWGIQRAGAQIAFSAIIFKRSSVKFYGTAIGIYSLISGFGVFIASSVSGYLAQISFKYVFILSSTFSLLSLIFIIWMIVRKKEFI